MKMGRTWDPDAIKVRHGHHAASITGEPHQLASDHPAIIQGRTLFPSTVVDAVESPRLLVSGWNQRKLGDRVVKGRWRGMPIFALTLEERATCPTSCHLYRGCYGNGMHLARRHRHSGELEYRLERELAALADKWGAGFVVRLHILGDFPDAAYAALWHRWLARFAPLRVFGFTAHEEDSDVGILIRLLNRDFPDRCVIRFSAPSPRGVPGVRYATPTMQPPSVRLTDAGPICPAQTGATMCCGTCGFCWESERDVVFVLHGNRHPGRPRLARADTSRTIQKTPEFSVLDPDFDEMENFI